MDEFDLNEPIQWDEIGDFEGGVPDLNYDLVWDGSEEDDDEAAIQEADLLAMDFIGDAGEERADGGARLEPAAYEVAADSSEKEQMHMAAWPPAGAVRPQRKSSPRRGATSTAAWSTKRKRDGSRGTRSDADRLSSPPQAPCCPSSSASPCGSASSPMSRATTLGDRRSSPPIPGDGGAEAGDDVRISRGRSFPLASTTARLSSDSRGSRHDAAAPPLSFKSRGALY